MCRKIFIFLLMISTLLANFSRLAITMGFDLNRKYIAGNLCENRNKPWLHCNGRCYMMKQIRQAEENEKKQDAKDNLSRLEVSFFQEPIQFSFIEPTIVETVKSTFTAYTYQYSSRYLSSIFRPPRQIA